VNLTAAHKFKAEGTRAEEESVPRHGRRGPSVHGWFKRLSDLPVFLRQISIWPLSIHTLISWAGFREHTPSAKTQKTPSLACSARPITHLIPEVRPWPGQRIALLKNAPGVFVPGPRCFATGVCSLRFTSGKRIRYLHGRFRTPEKSKSFLLPSKKFQ